MDKKDETFELRPYSRKEMRGFYGVSKYVFDTMVKPYEEEIGKEIGKYLSVKQVEIIFKRLGMPRKITISH